MVRSVQTFFWSQPVLKKLELIIKDVHQTTKTIPMKMLDAFVDLAFEIVDQPLLPSQVYNLD